MKISIPILLQIIACLKRLATKLMFSEYYNAMSEIFTEILVQLIEKILCMYLNSIQKIILIDFVPFYRILMVKLSNIYYVQRPSIKFQRHISEG